jgi:uncharacterized protein (DUF433 family)
MKTALLLAALTISAAGCKTTPPPTPLTQTDIISMTKAGMTDQEIINRIDGTRTVFRLTADNVVTLRQEGVSDSVVTYMLDTYTRFAVAEERRQSSPPFSFSFGSGQWN